MSFSELDHWDPMKEAYLASAGGYSLRNMNNRHFPRRNAGGEDNVETTKLFARGVPIDANEGALKNHFARCGKVVKMHVHRATEGPFTYAFITYSTPEEAQRALAELNGVPPFQLELSYARKRKDDRSGGKPLTNSVDVFNSPIFPAGQVSKGLATENAKQVPDLDSTLKVTASNMGRDVQWDQSQALLSHSSCNKAEDDRPSENKLNKNLSNGQGIFPTPVSHRLPNLTNSVPNHLPSPPPKCPSQSPQPPLSCSVTSCSRRTSGEFAETDFSSMPFLSTYVVLCFACDGKGVLCCSACRMPYCSPECQRKDWPHHKHKCAVLAPHFDRVLYQQSISAADSTTVEASSLHVNAAKKAEETIFPPPPVNSLKKIDRMKSFKKPDESSSQDVNAGKTPRTSSGESSPRSSQGGNYNARSKSQKKNVGAVHKNKMSAVGDRVKLDSPPQKHSTEEKSSTEPNESKLKPAETEQPQKYKARDLTSVVLSVSRNEEVDLSFALSPGQFWVQKASNRQTLLEIATELASLSEKKTSLPSPTIDDLCAAFYSADKSLYRGRITEVKDNVYSVCYFDYGNTETVTASSLYNLNEKLMSYPSQAVCCKLGGVKPPNSSNEWSVSDTAAFTETLVSLSTAWEARVIKDDLQKCEIDLVSSGTSLAAVLVKNKNAMYVEEEDIARPNPVVLDQPAAADNINMNFLKVPTVFTQLKAGSSLTLMQVYALKEGFYVHVTSGSDFVQYVEMQTTLKAPRLKDISSSAQKSSFAVALSPEFGTWYRCYVIDKKEQKSVVRFIDYGNEEEVSKLCQMDSPHWDICSPLLYCDFSHLPLSEKECIKNQIDFSGVVRKSEDGFTFDILNNQNSISVRLLPWWQGLSCDAPQGASKVAEAENGELVLPLTGKTNVKVVWINGTDNKIYVQSASQEAKIDNLEKELNEYCNSESQTLVPSVGNMVCAMFIDNKWYRSCVKQILPEEKCSVFFVDYGNEEIVTFKNMRKLPARYSSPASFCTCVSVLGLQSVTPEICGVMYEGVWELEMVNPSLKPAAVKLFRGGKNLVDILLSQKLILPQVKCDSNNDKLNSSPPNKVPCAKKKYNLKALREFESSPVCVVFVDGNKCPHLHAASDAPKLTQMQSSLNSFMQNDRSLSKYVPSVDDVVCAIFSEDNVWYRGTVTKIVDVNHCEVLFVDYGNTGIAAFKEVRPLPEQFAAIPVFDLKVRLHGVPVELMDHRVAPFLADAYKLVITDKSSKPIKVELFLNGKSVNQLLITHLAPRGAKSANNSETKSSALVNEKQQNVQKSSVVEVNCNGDAPEHSDTGYTSIPVIDMPVGNDKDLYIYNIYEPSLIFCAPYNEKGAKEFLAFSSSIDAHCKQVKNCHTPVVDETVLAKHPDVGNWQRAVILEVCEDVYQALFVDCGAVYDLQKESIKAIDEKFLKLPQQSVPCKLGGFLINDENVDTITKELLDTVKPPCRVRDVNVAVVDEEFVLDFPSFRKHLIEKGIIS